MQRVLLPILVAVLLFLLYGCAGSRSPVETAEPPEASSGESEASGEESPEASENSRAEAYYTVFKELYENDPALNDGIKYLALDLSGAGEADTDGVAALFDAFCGENNLTLLLDGPEALSDKGYIKDAYFENGILIGFEVREASETKIVVDAKKWRSGDGAIGATYEVTLKDGAWEITDTSAMWIS